VKHCVGILSSYVTLAQYTPERLQLHKPQPEIQEEAEQRVWELFQLSTSERVREITCEKNQVYNDH
jgi:hypothetical protein